MIIINGIKSRFFAYCINAENDVDICEVSERQFLAIKTCFKDSKIHYERHTVHENGVNQICLTIETPIEYPNITDLERI